MGIDNSAWVFEADEANFETDVLNKSKETPVVVDFWAEWCGPCRALAPMLENAVKEKNGEVLLAKVNTDENQQLAMKYRIEGLPTVLAFRDGKPVNEFVGVLPEAQLRQFLNEIVPSKADLLIKQAAELERNDPAQAQLLYEEALKVDNRLDAATVGLARILVANDKLAEAKALVQNISVDGELADELEQLDGMMTLRLGAKELPDEDAIRQKLDADSGDARAHYDLGCLLAAKGEYEPALDSLISAAEADLKLAQSDVRETMVSIFQIVGNQSGLANDYRRRLASLLY